MAVWARRRLPQYGAFEKQQAMPDTGRISGDLLTRLTRLSTTAPRTAERR